VFPKLAVAPAVLRSTPIRRTQRSKRVTFMRRTLSTAAARQRDVSTLAVEIVEEAKR
jgi:hypothetical protein